MAAEAEWGPVTAPVGTELVGTDLDGTLLTSSLTVGPRTLAALPRLRDVGVELVYVTGRPPRWLPPVVEQTGHQGIAVCANGALIVDLAEQRLLRSVTIDDVLAEAVVVRLRELVPEIGFAVERLADDAETSRDLPSVTSVGFEPAYDTLGRHHQGPESADILTFASGGRAVKILATVPAGSAHDSDSLLALAEAEFAGALHITHSGARTVMVEVMSGRIDKGVGFLEVARMRAVSPEHTVAVGDMPNDVPLLRAAGTGYAVANAHARALAAADHVIPSNDDDGVGVLLQAIVAARR